MNLKSFLHGLFYYVLRNLMNIPFNNIRILILRSCGAKIGNNVFIGRKCDIRKPKNIIIGNNTVINPKVILDGRGGSLTIGENVDIAMEAIIWTETHDPHDDYHRTLNYPTTIESYCWIGCRSMLMPGIIVGYGAVIAANAVVTKNVDSKTIVAGIPAKLISKRKSSLSYLNNYRPFFL